jgi:hypothetical protein
MKRTWEIRIKEDLEYNFRRWDACIVGNVADMSATCSPDTRCCSNSGQMGPCRRHKI